MAFNCPHPAAHTLVSGQLFWWITIGEDNIEKKLEQIWIEPFDIKWLVDRCGVFSPSPSSPSRARYRFYIHFRCDRHINFMKWQSHFSSKNNTVCTSSPPNLCRCCQAGCWWWPMPSRAMTSPLSARLRWSQVICIFLSGDFYFNLDLPGNKHSVLKHPRLEEPLLQVMFLSWICNACFVWGLLVYMCGNGRIRNPSTVQGLVFTCTPLFVFLLQFSFIISWDKTGIWNLPLVVSWYEREKIVFSAAKFVCSTRSLSWEKN